MAKTRPEVSELGGQNIGFLFGTMMDLRMLPTELKHTGKVEVGEFAMIAHFPASHAQNNTEQQYLARHKTFRGGLYATYQDGPYKIDKINWDATNRAGVHMVTKTKYGAIVEFPTQPSKSMPGSLKLMVQEYVESLKTPSLVIRCSGLGGALEPIKGKPDEYEVVLLNGDIKCPKKLHSHVPAKYHAEDDGRFNAQIGPWSFHAEEIIDGDNTQYRETTGKRQVTQVQKFNIVVDVDWETQEKVDTKYRQEIQQWAEQEIEEWMDYNIEEAIEHGDGDWEEDFYPDDGSDEIRVVFNWQLDDKTELGDSKFEDEDYWNYGAEEYEYWCSYCGDRGPKTSYPQWCKTYQNNGGAGYHSQMCGTCYDTHEGLCYYCESGDTEFAAYSDPITQRQKWKINDLGGTVKNNMNRSQASDYIKDLMGVPSGTWKAEEFAARSTAPANLSREKSNVKNAVSANYGSFKWGDCTWGPHFLRLTDESSNKFYSVWVWERSPGVYTAMGAYGGLGQNPRLFNITQTADLQRAINEAQKKMNQKQNKGYQTY